VLLSERQGRNPGGEPAAEAKEDHAQRLHKRE